MDEDQDLGWLIRDTSNRIRGPFRQAEVSALIKKGQLKGKTEIARANSYWFAIEEKTELGRFFPEFNGGKPPPEQPTQMTATLTEADIQDHGVEITTFTSVAKDSQKPAEAAEQRIEWLSDEFAEEFGDDFGAAASPPAGEAMPAPQDLEKEKEREREAKAQEMLRRATVKADTLPSEHKNFHGERPKPIDTLMRSPGSKTGSSAIKEATHATVSVPIEDGPAPKMLHEDDEARLREKRARRSFLAFGAVALLVVAAGAAAFLLPSRQVGRPAKDPPRAARRSDEAMLAARQSILAFDLEGAKSALADLELEPASRSEASTYLAQGIVKKEFLYDVEGAMLALQTARQQARNRRVEAEVDNLMAIYGFDRDPGSSAEMLRKNVDAYRDDPLFRYNLALAYLRTNRSPEAIAILDALLGSAAGDSSLAEDIALAHGWAIEAHCSGGVRDAVCKRSSEAEEAYLRALEANPSSAKARLGLALYRLRHNGMRGSENDFRSFLDLAPELDPPSRVMNFRKLSNAEFYAFAHAQIVELATPGQSTSKPSALIMAADALISAIQGRTSEGGKILESALSVAPGDANVLKVSGYLRWKDGQLNELVDALKDLRDRGGFAVNLMLGKSYLKLRRREQAEKHFRALIDGFPNRSEGYSLLGELLLEQPETAADAKAQFQQALKKDPLDLLALRGLLRLNAPAPVTPDLLKNLPF